MLTDKEVSSAKARDRAYFLTDGYGLVLEVRPTGKKFWRYRDRENGRDTTTPLGPYPTLSLTDARQAAYSMRKGEAPADNVESRKSFEEMALAWHKVASARWSDHHAADVLGKLKEDIFPALGKSKIGAITTPDVLAALKAIEARGANHVVHKLRHHVNGIFRYAKAIQVIKSNPAEDLGDLLMPLPRATGRAAQTTLDSIRQMRAAGEDAYAYPVTRLAFRFLMLTVVRPGEMRGAEWPEFAGLDGETPEWVIPAERMKGKKDQKMKHWVPLSRQAVETLAELKKLTGNYRFAFPSATSIDRCMSESAIGDLMDRAGYKGTQTAHGLRASFSSVMNEKFKTDHAVIELMLAHRPKDKVKAAYDRALHAERRRELAQIWADMVLEGAPSAADLVDRARKAA